MKQYQLILFFFLNTLYIYVTDRYIISKRYKSWASKECNEFLKYFRASYSPSGYSFLLFDEKTGNWKVLSTFSEFKQNTNFPLK